MKKIFSAVLAILMVFSPLAMCIYAVDGGMTFDENTLCKVTDPYEKVPNTLEAWIYLDPSYTERGGVILGNYGGARACINFEINKNGVPRLYYVDPDKTVHDFKFSKVDVRTGDWAHIAFVHDGAAERSYFYLNGDLVGTVENTPEYAAGVNSYEVVIGGDNRDGNGQYFKGKIRSVSLYADARTEKEIRSGMTAGPNIIDDDLIAHYDLTSVSGSVIEDGSGNGYAASYVRTWFTEKAPVTDYAYSFAVVGDTQVMAYKYPDQFHKIYDWIIANKDEKKIAHVMGLGDITEKNAEEEWALAKESIDKMNGVVDYTLVIGNHDKTAQYNATFGTDTYKSNFEGFYSDGKIENSYRRFTVADTDYLLITLEYGAGDDILNWAGKIIERYDDHRVIITTHCYLYRDGTTLDKNDVCPPNTSGEDNGVKNNGDQMWDKLVSKYKNVFLVLSGHDPCANVVTTQTKGIHGNTVTQMLIDPQGVDNNLCATGMVAMLYFSNDGKTITVENYSTVREQFFMTENQYTIDISDWVEGANGGSGENGGIGGTDGPTAVLFTGSIIPFVIGAVALFVVGAVVGFVFVKKKRG